METQPSTTEGNGRVAKGRFGPGNRFAKGNPHAAKVAKLRSAALNAVTQKDIRGIIRKLVALGLAGDVQAAKEVFQRTQGPAIASDVFAEITAMEERLCERIAMLEEAADPRDGRDAPKARNTDRESVDREGTPPPATTESTKKDTC